MYTPTPGDVHVNTPLTQISIAYLQFIEEDRERGLPHDSYLRGYLAQYARAIGLDPQTVADGYLHHLKALRSAKR